MSRTSEEVAAEMIRFATLGVRPVRGPGVRNGEHSGRATWAFPS